MTRIATKTEQGYMDICRCERAGMSRVETSQELGINITEFRWNQALQWNYKQISVRSEIESVYNAYKQIQELKRDAMAFFRMQRTTVTMDAKKINTREISRLIEKELEYADRIRELAGHLVGDEGDGDGGRVKELIAEFGGERRSS